MSEIDHALSQIDEIRERLARSSTFRGFGSEVLLATAGGAVIASIAQGALVRGAVEYGLYWSLNAAFSVALIAVEAWRRARAEHAGRAPALAMATLWAILPSGFAGAFVTAALLSKDIGTVQYLPGLWQVILSLGVFAMAHGLPRHMRLVGAWYLASGIACLLVASPTGVPSPWLMAIPFGVGQSIAALVLAIDRRRATR